ncbi:MAG TPA: P1 family peptidase [Gemmatimonadaceae bacterium]|nr:P1 family peptidase [Gemmatimonadaceae bacterium]
MNEKLPVFAVIALMTLSNLGPAPASAQQSRPRARDIGLVVGILDPGPQNAITDVTGVRVGQVTVVEGDSVRTGVTAIIPHPGNLFRERVPAALYVGNGFGKLLGITQLRELGELETPILLTCTLCVWKAADAMVDWMLHQPGMQGVGSINPVVGETNDGALNSIRSRPITADHVVRALQSATSGPVAEGSVGAGTGTVAFGWKGGIGTSSRQLPATLGGHTVGVLVQSNFGGVLTMNGAPVGRELGRYSLQRELERTAEVNDDKADGSIMIVVATDAPLDARNLERLAARAIVGLGRTGSSFSNGSGDYVIAFSTSSDVRMRADSVAHAGRTLSNNATSPLFQAVAEATEEAIYNSLLRATTVTGSARTVEALPIDRTLEILKKYRVLDWNRSLPPGSLQKR